MSDQPQNDATDGIGARLLAFDTLHDILADGQSLDDTFDRRQRAVRGPMADRDRAHARLMVLTVLRRLGQIDVLLNRYLKRTPTGKGRGALTLMRLGAAQMMFLETPPHAAVSTALAVADKRRMAGFKGLINAVLRKLAGALPNAVKTQDAARLNTPDWLWTACEAAYGSARTRSIMAAHLVEPPLDLTVKGGGDADWADRLGAERLPTGSLRLWRTGDLRRLAGFTDGAWWVQDAAAALPARLLLSRVADGDGPARIADLCAAPGGKTAQLAAAGAAVTAVDRSEQRLGRLRENLQRLGLTAEIVAADILDWQTDGLFDGVLLDAPCSATGTIRRHPDLPWRKESWNRDELTALQTALLAKAATLLKPGAPMVYATCSLLPEEGEAVIAAALRDGVPLAVDPVAAGELPGLPDAVTDGGFLRTFPYDWQMRSGARRGGLDGFFAARLVRI